MTAPRVLIVDDEPDLCDLLALTLRRMKLETVAAGDLDEARRLLERDRFDLCLTDMRLPDGDGLDLVRHIQRRCPELPVAVITAHGNMDTAIEALKAGAFDFLSKPLALDNLRDIVRHVLKLPRRVPAGGEELLGESPAMREIRSTIARLARSQAPVHIHGESGTGKELVARLIHRLGPRAEAPFVAVNCGAIPAELMESEFFGHVKGSFTGAVRDKPGLFQSAHGGTLFLDEIGELPLTMQVKLLRAIQDKQVRPVGGEREVPTDVRILSATHQDLATMVGEGRFRQDLYYRIHVIALRVPPLRERPGDIPALAAHLLERVARRDGRPVPRLGRAALEALCAHPFPGNVRELENILERAVALCEEDEIRPEHLHLQQAPAAPPPAGDLPSLPLDEHLREVERRAIQAALERTRFNKTAAARLLGISFRALRYKMEKLGLE